MFNQKIEEDLALKAEIEDLLDAMSKSPKDSKEYVTMTDQLTKLYALKPNPGANRISKDTLVIVAGNLAGILTIVMAEKSSVLSAKGLSLLSKIR